MDLLNSINLYTMQSSKITNNLKKSLCENEEIIEKTEIKTQKNTEMQANDVLNFMANQSVSMNINISKTIKINKILSTTSTEQYNRIGNFMKDFENTFEEGLDILNTDFTNLNLSENTKANIALKSIDKII
ncbi:hypothetical protein IJG14_08555 [bacterium]|nr:hypothetical protein [bacterium]